MQTHLIYFCALVWFQALFFFLSDATSEPRTNNKPRLQLNWLPAYQLCNAVRSRTNFGHCNSCSKWAEFTNYSDIPEFARALIGQSDNSNNVFEFRNFRLIKIGKIPKMSEISNIFLVYYRIQGELLRKPGCSWLTR